MRPGGRVAKHIGPMATVPPYVLIRFNLLPVQQLAAPGGKRWQRWFDRLHQLETWKLSHATTIADHLHELVPGVTDDLRRRVVLPLRRDVFNNRIPGAYAYRLGEVTDDPLAVRWVAVQREISYLTREIEQRHPEVLATERAGLLAASQHPEFRRALVLSSPLTFRALQEYASGSGSNGKRARRAEASLLRYYTRAAAKTSPFSRYTAVGFGVWTDHGAPASPPLGHIDLTARSQVRPNHVLVLRLVDLAVHRPGGMHALRYRLARRARLEGDRVRFEVDTDDPAGQPRVFRTTEKVVALRANQTLTALVRWLEGHPDGVSFQTLEDLLRSASAGQAPHKATAFLERLVTAGLLVPDLGLDEQDPDFMGQAVRLLETLPEEQCLVAAAHLRAIAEDIARFGDMNAVDRDRCLVAIQAQWRDAYRTVGGRASDAFPLFEDCAAPGFVPMPRPAWRETLEHLRQVERLIAVFDDYHVLNATVRAAFHEQFGSGGTCHDLNEFAALLPTAYERAWSTAVGWPEEITATDPVIEAQLQLRAYMADELSRRMAGVERDCQLDEDFIADIYARLPERIRREWTSWSLFVQPEVRDGSLGRVVLNRAYAGLGQFGSRFLHLLEPEATRTVRRHLRQFFPDDRVLTELRPVFGFNANIHPLLAEHEVNWDGRPRQEAIDVSDISLRHDPVADELVMYRSSTGARLEVLYLGFLVPYALPYRLASFYAVNGRGQTQLNFTDLVDRRRRGADTKEIRGYPRICLGNVVLARRRWYVPRDLVPVPYPNEPEAAYFTRVNLWRLRHAMPEQVFYKELKEFDIERVAVSEGDLQRELARMRAKPQFVDLTSPLQVMVLGRWMRESVDDLQLEEVLPALADGALRAPDGTHAAELVVELNRRATYWTGDQG
jgi:lantibiotic biosynthesis dehydratase-like protein